MRHYSLLWPRLKPFYDKYYAMIKQFLFTLAIVLSLVICSCNHGQILQPTQNTMGTGVLHGRCLLYDFGVDTSNQNEIIHGRINKVNAGTLVQLLGTSVSSRTDSSGHYELTGIDSGLFQIRFTHTGYDTVLISNVALNGHDTASLAWHAMSPDGQDHTDTVAFLLQNQPTVSTASASAFASCRVDSVIDSGSGRVQYLDTVFSIAANFVMQAHASSSSLQRMLRCGYCVRISNASSIPANERPSDFEIGPWQASSLGYISFDAFDSPHYYDNNVTQRAFALNNDSDRVVVELEDYVRKCMPTLNLIQKPSLFLHVIPVWRALSRRWYDVGSAYTSGPYGRPSEQWILGEVYTIPIQWK